MNASPTRKKSDPLAVVLFDLQNLKEDIAYLLEPVPSFQSLNKMTDFFIKGIQKARAEQRELYPEKYPNV
jgi:hypothetical protein